MGRGAAVLISRLLVLAGRGVGDLALTGWFRWYNGLHWNYPFNKVGTGLESWFQLDLITLV